VIAIGQNTGKSERRELRIHELKTWPNYFEDTLQGLKTFEYRKDDRGFRLGDLVYLREYNPYFDEYSGRYLIKRIAYGLSCAPGIGLPEGYCVLQLTDVDPQILGKAKKQLGLSPSTTTD
jgi:hypothetical protein